MSARWNQGDTVVHPVHGVATVVGTEERDLGAGPVTYVRLQAEDLLVLVPEDDLDEGTLRDPIDAAHARRILQLLGEDSGEDPGHRARRRRNSARLQSGEPERLAKVVRSLQSLREASKGGLREADARHLDDALSRLAEELAVALNIDVAQARERIETAFDAES